MKNINFETNEPLFSLKEIHEIMAFATGIIAQARVTKSVSFKEWASYIDRWCEANYMPEEIKSALYETIIPSLNTIKRHE